MRSFNIFFDLRLNNGVNNGEAGDLRAHYDVTVMLEKPVLDKMSNQLLFSYVFFQ